MCNSKKIAENWDNIINWKKRFQYNDRAFLTLLKKKKIHKILDLAAGTGVDSIYFLNNNIQIDALDKSKYFLRRLKINEKKYSIVKKKINLINLNWRNLDKIKKKYDCIICLGNSFACELDKSVQEKFIANCKKILKKGGILIIDHRNNEKQKIPDLKELYGNNDTEIKIRIFNDNYKAFYFYKKKLMFSLLMKIWKIKDFKKIFFKHNFNLVRILYAGKTKRNVNASHFTYFFERPKL